MKRGLLIAAMCAACVISWLPNRTVQAAVAGRPSLACGFKHAVWSDVDQTDFVRVESPYWSTEDVDNAQAKVDEHMAHALIRYRYPNGWYVLSSSLGRTWSHIRGISYWSTQALASSTDDGETYDLGQEQAAENAASASLRNAWSAIKGICPGH